MKIVPALALIDWTRCESDRDAGCILGVTGSSISRWRKEGRALTLTQAEDFCDRLGIHPTEVWPNWYEMVAATEGATLCGHGSP